MYYVHKIKELLNYLDKPHRLLYGSDWPISNMESYIKFVDKLKLDKQSRDHLLFKNSQYFQSIIFNFTCIIEDINR